MRTRKSKAKGLVGALMAACMLLTSAQAAFLVSAETSGLPENPEISMPEITTENGLLWYKLDEDKGPAKNSIPGGEARDSVEASGTFLPDGGVDGGAIQFSGGGYQHISVNKDNDKSDLFLKDAYTEETVSFWFKPERLTGIQMLFAQGGKVGGIAVRLNEGILQTSVSTGTPNILDDVDVSDCLNKWTHVTVVFADQTANLYVNGELKTTQELNSPAMGVTGVGTTIGNNHTRANVWDSGSNTREFKGLIDDLRIYKAAVIPQVTLQEVSGYADKSVPNGTAQDALGLPETLTARLSSSQSADVPVSWTSAPAYDGNTAGDYVFTAGLPENMLYDGNIQLKVTVEEPAEGPEPKPDLDNLPDHPDIRLADITTENGLLWYKLDETKGPAKNAIPDGEAHDSVEVIGDFKPAGGVDGGAIQFSGKDYQHITINTDGSSSTFLKEAYTEETVAFWYKPDRLTGIQMLYAQGSATGGIHIRLNEDKLQVSVSTGEANILDDVDVSESQGRWTHIAVSFDKGTASVYVNGELKASKTTANPALGTSTMGTTIGNNHTRANPWDGGSSTREFQGMIDDLRIYKTAVAPQAFVRGFSGYEDKTVLTGTSQDALHLPSEVTAHLSSVQTMTVPVTGWTSKPAYDGNKAGVYVFTAALDLPGYLMNKQTVQVTITVKDDTGESDPELDAALPKAKAALSGFVASKTTTAQDVLDAVVRAIDNPNISAAWENDPVITLPEGLTSGSMKGTIVISKGKYSEKLSVDLLIPSLEDGLRLRYEFEDGKAADVSGNGRDGASYGTLKEADGINGKAMYFSGGYVHMPEDVIQGLERFSVSVWINPLSDFQYARVWDIGSGENNFVNLWLRSDTERKYSCNIRLNESTTQRNQAEKATFKTGTWRNLVVTYDEADNSRITIYEDGEMLASIQTGKKLSQMGAATNALLGWSQMKNDYDYHGYMDDFRIYDRTLTAEEVGSLAAEGTDTLVKKAADKLDIAAFNGFTELTGVAQNLNLQGAADIQYSGAAISWKSSDTVLSDSGVLADVSKDSTATLTATLTRDGKAATKDFPLTVKADRTISPDPVPDVITVPGLYPDLPEKITANGGKASAAVTWATPAPTQYAGAGEFTLDGTAAGQKVTVTVKVDGTQFTNPLMGPASADPFFYYKDGYYYYVRSSYGGLTVSKAKRFQDIGNVPRVMVYSQEEAPSEATRNWWAPEIHYLEGNWYIYWAANDGKSENHRMFVLESTDPNNAQAPYVMKSQLAPTKLNERTGEWEVDAAEDMWAIDGTVFTNKDGRSYFLWAGYDGSAGNFQKLFIAEMLNPWTLKGGRTLISQPELPFEIRGGGYKLNEGPQVVKKGNKVHVLYSSCQANYDWYSLGLLSADADDDLLNASSWTKNPGPVFTKSNNSADESFGTGHAMVVQSPDGTEDWLIYHAYQIGNQTNHMGDMEGRNTRAVKISWDENDMPIFGNPVAYDVLQEQPSGTADAVALKYEAETAVLSGAASVTNVTQASGRKIVQNIDQNSSVTFNIEVPVAGRYLVSFMGNSRSASGHTGYQNANINGTDYKIWHRGNNAGVANKWMPSALADAEQVGSGLYVNLPAGESTITVTYHPDATANCDLDYLYLLLDDSETEPSISLDQQAVTLQKGESATLTATVDPAETTVKWSSSNEKVATVDQNGKITALSSGTAVITAELPDGTKATCTVTVYLLGDLNNDGSVTITDVMEACKVLARKSQDIVPSADEILRGDLTGDGFFTITDVMAICKILASKE